MTRPTEPTGRKLLDILEDYRSSNEIREKKRYASEVNTYLKANAVEFAIRELEKLRNDYVLAPGGNHYVSLDDVRSAITRLKGEA